MSSTDNQTTQPKREKLYVWEEGDTFALIAVKYRRDQREYIDILDLNARLVRENNWIMRAGDIIEVPEHWFPLKEPAFQTKLNGSRGRREELD